jgi:hypothetical protein
VPPTRPDAWRRFVLVLFAGGLWAGLAVRPALGMGCHINERPALGLSEAGRNDVIALVQPESHVPVVATLPCRDDLPGSQRIATSPLPTGAIADPTTKPPLIDTSAVSFGHSRVRPVHTATPVDRPPRDRFRSA